MIMMMIIMIMMMMMMMMMMTMIPPPLSKVEEALSGLKGYWALEKALAHSTPPTATTPGPTNPDDASPPVPDGIAGTFLRVLPLAGGPSRVPRAPL
jgi:hypothetical protein